MNTQEIRQKYLEFCQRNGHAIIERAPLILHNDPTTLFTGSGMQPLLPYLLGQDHPQGTKLADSQTCLRAQDIEDVGDNRHTTFFEMLGNWSMGEYFKRQQIEWFFEFIRACYYFAYDRRQASFVSSVAKTDGQHGQDAENTTAAQGDSGEVRKR